MPINGTTNQSLCLSIYLPIYLSIYPSIYLSICLAIYQSIYLWGLTNLVHANPESSVL